MKKKNPRPKPGGSLILTGLAAAVLCSLFILPGCTVKAVGDPNRPITINANVVVDIRGLKQTASSIEDRVEKGS